MVNTVNQLEFAIKKYLKGCKIPVIAKGLAENVKFFFILFISSIAKTTFCKLVNEW